MSITWRFYKAKEDCSSLGKLVRVANQRCVWLLTYDIRSLVLLRGPLGCSMFSGVNDILSHLESKV